MRPTTCGMPLTLHERPTSPRYHHCTITAPSLHHHCTITAPSLRRFPSPLTPSQLREAVMEMLPGTITAPSLRHHCTITAPSLHHHCDYTIQPTFLGFGVKLSCFVLHHHCTITTPSLRSNGVNSASCSSQSTTSGGI